MDKKKLENRIKITQARRHGGGGAFRGRAQPPKSLLVPPQTRNVPHKRGLRPKESNKLGATGVQFEA